MSLVIYEPFPPLLEHPFTTKEYECIILSFISSSLPITGDPRVLQYEEGQHLSFEFREDMISSAQNQR